MNKLSILLCSLAFHTVFAAENLGELVFQDDFERTESQELKDEPGKDWGTNSKRLSQNIGNTFGSGHR